MTRGFDHTLSETVATDAGGNLIRRRARLTVVEGPDHGVEVELDRSSVIVGSSSGADLVLTDPRISRTHAELSLVHRGVRVRDLESRNGTFVGQARIESLVVPLPVTVKLGRTVLELRPADEPLPQPLSARTRFGELAGASHATRRLFGILERVSPTDAPVLLEGESGVGKTATAAAIHQESGRPGPCSYVDLAASTGEASLDAAFAEAARGTLVLEHVDRARSGARDALQSRLESWERAAERPRVVSTATEDVRRLLERGAFPRTLYFHLGVVHLTLPPLRERPEDVPLILQALVTRLGGRLPAPAELEQLRAEDYPGNVRTLRGLVDRVSGPAGGATQRGEGAAGPPSSAGYHEAKEQVLSAFERDYFARLLEEHDGNVSAVARAASMSRSHLITLLKKHGLL